ncbi:MAG: DUF859 family phage minor structural protein [Eubacterium sp.]|jgi:hypothetical protein|nr:DUF859 family phage minor structural protein [Eubacterium sp.]MCH4078570.1 DUF859 family phage minor structural protein [Eubacterium sp.]MCH4109711.1 DUF859 family phage minor structural protein [Eubacterium sp.]
MPATISIGIIENSTSVSSNSSNVTVKVTAKWTSGTFDHNPPKLTVTIDGDKYTKYVSLNPNNTTSGSNTIYSKTLDIEHNSDGSKKLTVSASYATSTSSGTVKDSLTKTLTTIARKSAPTCPSSGTLGTALTINTNRKSSSFTHTLTASWNGKTDTIATKTNAASVSWTPPLSWCTEGLSGTCTITCTTYNGSTSLGSNTCSLILKRQETSVLFLSTSSCIVDGTSSVQITTQGNYSGYTHHLYYRVNSLTGTDGIADPAAVGTTTFTPPLDLLNSITTSASSTCTVFLETCYEDSVLATDQENLTLIVPSSVIPKAEISEVTDTVFYDSDKTETLLQHYGGYVAGKSIPKMTIAGTESYSSPVTTYFASFTEGSYLSSTLTEITADREIKEGTSLLSSFVMDARSRSSDTAEKSVTVLPYSSPSVTSLKAARMTESSDGSLTADESGNCLRVSYGISVSPLNNRNSKSAVLTWTNITDKSTGAINLTMTSYQASGQLDLKDADGYVNFLPTSRYQLTLTVSDDFGSSSASTIVQTAEVILDFHASGKGLAIGKISEGAGFECQYDAKFNGGINYKGKELLDLIYPVGSIYLSVNSASPADLFGGTWERIKDTFLLAAGDTYAAGSTGGSEDAVVVKHNHLQESHTHTQSAHKHGPGIDGARYLYYNYSDVQTGVSERSVASASGNYKAPVINSSSTDWKGATYTSSETAENNETTAVNIETGVDGSGKNMPPYFAVYMWKRTA